jgi:DNA-3-methyladenine glycosylase
MRRGAEQAENGLFSMKNTEAGLETGFPANQVLSTSFYDRPTATVARDLLGKVLRVRVGRTWRSGVITETEAYVKNDPANHAYRGPNKRNQSMFKGPGTTYVYGIHQVFCVNAVTRRGEAVLIRAIRPMANVALRGDGPGRLCRALNITKGKHDGKNLTGPLIQIVKGRRDSLRIAESRRIGVTKAKNRLLRFYVKHRGLSRKKARRPALHRLVE